jgi:hypothetical protein
MWESLLASRGETKASGARCPHATSWLCGSYRTAGSLGTHSTARRRPFVAPRGDSGQRVQSDSSDRFPAAA